MGKREKCSKKGGLGKFLLGAAMGAGIALLFAPQDGKTTRRQLKAKFDELAAKVKEIKVQDVKDAFEKKIADIKEDLKDMDAEKALAIAKEKATVIIKKCDELVKLAVEKGTPIVQKAVNDLRLKTIDVLEDTITKLENVDKKEATVTTIKTTVAPNKKVSTKVSTKKATKKTNAK